MQIDQSELIVLADAYKLFPRGVSWRTIYKFRSHGVRMPDGSNLKLYCRKIGGRYFTCAQWINEFLAAQNGGELTATDAEKTERQGAVDAELERMGC